MAGIDIFGGGWLFGLPGLILVYTYFQIPLMVIVFMPALTGSTRSGARRRSTSGPAPGSTGPRSRSPS